MGNLRQRVPGRLPFSVGRHSSGDQWENPDKITTRPWRGQSVRSRVPVPHAQVTLILPPERPRDGSNVDHFVVYMKRGTGHWYVHDAVALT